MKLYEIVQKGIYINDKALNQFTFSLFDERVDRFITIEKPTIKDFIQLCDREVSYIDTIKVENDIKIDITVPLDAEKDNEMYYTLKERIS